MGRGWAAPLDARAGSGAHRGQAGVTRRMLAAGAGAFALAGCVTPQTPGDPPKPRAAIPRLDLTASRLMRITVCSRPFRAAGPRIEAEAFGAKLLVHNYGHGGAGWSLAWGSAAAAADLALEPAPADAAVIGAGAIGLTTATILQRRGVATTIYAAELPPETRSARATGTWSPDSRIALSAAADPGFGDRWEAMTRASFAAHQAYVGLAGAPVEWTPRYMLSDAPAGPRPPYDVQGFASLYRRVRDLGPRSEPLEGAANPFPTAQARRGMSLTFNIAEYAHHLTMDFLAAGGRIVQRVIPAPQVLLALPEQVIVNCTGYGARALFGDDTLTPVRGQIGWLAPQPEALYGVYYRNVGVLSRRDGVAVQFSGDDDSWGFGLEDETPDREEFAQALARVAGLFG